MYYKWAILEGSEFTYESLCLYKGRDEVGEGKINKRYSCTESVSTLLGSSWPNRGLDCLGPCKTTFSRGKTNIF